MTGRLDGKVCIVTGTGGSMGRATALTFAREGASVVGCDLGVDPAEETVAMVRAAGGRWCRYRRCRVQRTPPSAAGSSTGAKRVRQDRCAVHLAAKSHFSPIEKFTDRGLGRARRDEVDLGVLPHPRRMAHSRPPTEWF